MSTTTEPYAALVMWALGARRSFSLSSLVLARAVTADLVAAALATPAIRDRLADVPVDRSENAIRALAIVARNRNLLHSYDVRVGRALLHLPEKSANLLIGGALSSTQPSAANTLGNALGYVAKTTPVNLVEFVTLLTDWDHLDLRARSRVLALTAA